MLTAESSEIDRLRSEQRRAAQDALALTRRIESCLIPGDKRCKPADVVKAEREREYCMLGVNDYFVEEMILLYWKEAISNQLSAVSHKSTDASAQCAEKSRSAPKKLNAES